jgi:hypothetical protein
MGMMVVAGLRFPVTRLALRGGQLEITAQGPGPCPVLRNEPVAVFGEDDVGMIQGGYMTTTTEAGPRDTVLLTVTVRTTEITDEGPLS